MMLKSLLSWTFNVHRLLLTGKGGLVLCVPVSTSPPYWVLLLEAPKEHFY